MELLVMPVKFRSATFCTKPNVIPAILSAQPLPEHTESNTLLSAVSSQTWKCYRLLLGAYFMTP